MWRSAFVTVHIQSVGAFRRRRKRENAPAANFFSYYADSLTADFGGK